ncbi:hypothetical protein HS088_TW07G01089 [Tripterygium wilfordii]|uniref:Transposase, Ptta/En/Spm, plant n=1 Tax=Tripterygium wilfordii TaxID=458696 RepID=A0A7J7DGN4_TRIWF|nr:uncharacterized protein LOC120002587 [Tripterygium wilfordii]KAF5745502.1 hypothetical protein HS088_TW07G01089 [Tripterygium wilfordii]
MPYPSWKKIPPEVRKIWFREFEKRFTWLPHHDPLIRANFEKRGATRMKDMLSDVHVRRIKPDWIVDSVWEALCNHWISEHFKKISVQNKRNRTFSENGVSLHTGGFAPATKYARKMEEELGRKPTVAKLFMRMHMKKNKTWVDTKSGMTYNKFTDKMSQLEASQSTGEGSCSGDQHADHPLPSELDLWKETVGGKRKGRLYGLGLQSTVVSDASSRHSSFSNHWDEDEYIQEKVRTHVSLLSAELNTQLEMERNGRAELATRLESLQQENIQYKRLHSKAMKKLNKTNKMVSLLFKQMNVKAIYGASTSSQLSLDEDECEDDEDEGGDEEDEGVESEDDE